MLSKTIVKCYRYSNKQQIIEYIKLTIRSISNNIFPNSNILKVNIKNINIKSTSSSSSSSSAAKIASFNTLTNLLHPTSEELDQEVSNKICFVLVFFLILINTFTCFCFAFLIFFFFINKNLSTSAKNSKTRNLKMIF